MIAMLQGELDRKSEQLAVKDKQIEELNARLAEVSSALVTAQQTAAAAQALHAGTMHQQLLSGKSGADQPERETEPVQKRSWFSRFFGDFPFGVDVNIGCLNATGFSNRIITSKGGIIMLNKNIKALRKAKGLSQEELAIKLNVVRQTVSKWEKGLSVPDAGMVVQIAEVLDTTVNVLLGEEIPVSEEPDFTKTLAAKLEVLNEQYSKQNEHRRKIWRVVFTVVLIVSAISLIRYLLFFGSIYHMKNIGDASASTSVTVIGGSDVSALIPIWYYLSVLKPVFISVLAAITSIVGLCRTRKN